MTKKNVENSKAAIVATSVSKSYTVGQIRTQVLFDIDISINPGELTLISGPSGCGKSTLLAILSGLTKPDQGRVVALGSCIWEIKPSERDSFRLKNTGFVFQGFNLFSALTAEEQVAYVLQCMKIPPAEALERARAALRSVGLEHKKHLRPLELSGGEKQRVAVARALAKCPLLLFADEPTSALDSKNGQSVTELLREIAHANNAAVLCVSHDPRLLEYADRVIKMEDGRITYDSNTERPSKNLAQDEVTN